MLPLGGGLETRSGGRGGLHVVSNWVEERTFQVFLSKAKETTLAEALRKAVDFIRAIEICTVIARP